MNKLIYLLILIPGFLFTSCAPEPEHLYPLSYLPAYPGSYWKYIDSFGDTTESTVEGDYILDSIPGDIPSYYDVPHEGESYYVPVYDDQFLSKSPLWEYMLHFNYSTALGPAPFHKLVDEVTPVGGSWCYTCSQYSGLYPEVVARDTTVIVNGISYYPTIVIDFMGVASSYTQLWKRYYFTKDIGIVMVGDYNMIITDNGDHDTLVNTHSLYEYHINH